MFVPFSITQDEVADVAETFTITLSIPANGNAIVQDATKVATVTITDDDFVQLSVALSAPVSVVEGDNISVILTATNTNSSDKTINVDLQASNGTGTYLNYTNTPIEIIAAASTDTSKTVTIQLKWSIVVRRIN